MLLLLKNILFTIVVPGTVAGFIPVSLVDHGPMAFTGPAIFGAALLSLGIAIYSWCVWDFAVSGQGTPAPIDPPKSLVIRGLYQYTRNPMYLGVVCVIAGWAGLFGSVNLVIYGACVISVFHLVVLIYEEPHLRRSFGTEYDSYCSRVGRWLPFKR